MKKFHSPKLAILPALAVLLLNTAARAEDGWISMFNGTDLTG